MRPPIDATRELRELAALAADPDAVERVLDRALDALRGLVPYDLAAVLELVGTEELRVRTARGPLAGAKVRSHRLDLARFPTLRRAMETRRPFAPTVHEHSSEEGDPYDGVLDLPDGHSCMVVPLYAADRTIGIMTFDRQLCEPYPAPVVEMAGVYGQIVSLALAYAEQAALLERYRRRLKEHNKRLVEDSGGGAAAEARLERSRSPGMAALLRQARMVARTDAPVLLLGETGTGKEVVAQALHHWSPRGGEPFVRLNCAALPRDLVESELFGHVKGAFSGAVEARTGRFLSANGGTLLLDEIGDLPLELQGKLLRVLQEGSFEPVGSDRTVQVDVRVIAATHVNLEAAVAAKRFRQDLFYRLAVFPLTIPALRDRRADVGPIAEGFLERLTRSEARGPWTLPAETLTALEAHDWPGNVRELVNALERATILCPRGALSPDHFRFATAAPPAPAMATVEGTAFPTLEEVERQHIIAALQRAGGKVYGAGGAAGLLGLKPSTLQSRMEKLGVEKRG